jgi:ubiquinone/menaquinone biosynthesis C-methylase UbiE
VKTEWDYTSLADAYLKRPDYAQDAIDAMLEKSTCPPGGAVCDVGAGAGHLTRMLAAKHITITAVEPNDAMRAHGISRTQQFPHVRWFEGTGEHTGQPDGAFDLVTFGSSFNVTDRPKALLETVRILKPRGWFACMWNHRWLVDPIQSEIEAIIGKLVPGYSYGTRREDQTELINASGLFGPVQTIKGTVTHTQSVQDCIEAWRSHGTLQRQAGEATPHVVEAIAAFLTRLKRPVIEIPYATCIWLAQRNS